MRDVDDHPVVAVIQSVYVGVAVPISRTEVDAGVPRSRAGVGAAGDAVLNESIYKKSSPSSANPIIELLCS